MKNKIKFFIKTTAVLVVIMTIAAWNITDLKASQGYSCPVGVDLNSCLAKAQCDFNLLTDWCDSDENDLGSDCYLFAYISRSMDRSDCGDWFEDPRLDHSGCDFLNEIHNGHGS